MPRTYLSIAALFAALLSPASAQEQPAMGPAIGIIAPLTGSSAILGAQLRDGATVAAAQFGATLTIEDDACTAEGGKKATQKLIARKVVAVVGFLCGESIEAAMPELKAANIPVITVGVRTNSLTDRREKTGWPVFRLAPRGDAEAAAAAAIIPRLWRTRSFAIVDDGTIHGRELAEVLRASVEEKQLKPVFLDVFRPQLENQVGLLGRLRKAGATHVFVGGDGEDIAVMARDAQERDYKMSFAGGETLRTTFGLLPGVLMIGLPDWKETAEPAVLQSFAARRIIPDGYVLPAHAATQIAVAAAKDADVGKAIAAGPHVTAIGPISFNTKGDLAVSPYRAYQFDGAAFIALETP